MTFPGDYSTSLWRSIKPISYGQFPRDDNHEDFLKLWWDWLIHNDHFWEAQITHEHFREAYITHDPSYDRLFEFPGFRKFSPESMVSEFCYRAQKSKADFDSTQVALSALTQRVLYTKLRAESNVTDEGDFTVPGLSSGKHTSNECSHIPWNDAVSCALFGIALVDTDKRSPSQAMSYYFRQCLEGYLTPTELPLQSQPVPVDRAAALAVAITGDANLLQIHSGDDWQDFACVAFLRGAETGNLTVLRIIPAVKSGVYSTDLLQRSTLHLASINGHCRMVQRLLELEADANAADWFGCSPLHYASECKGSNQSSNLESIRLLCASGADLNARTTPLGRTPLHIAARCGQDGSARQLLELGASDKLLDNDGSTPWNLAIKHRSPDVVKVLFEYNTSTDSRFRDGVTIWHIAAKYEFFKLADLSLQDASMIDSRDEMGFAPLHVAAHFGNNELISMLCKEGASVDILNNDAETPLHIATRKGHADAVKTLLENRASIEATNDFGQTSLHIATANKDFEMVKTLMERGASVDASNNSGQTSLHIATSMENLEMVKTLMEHGASVDASNDSGLTSLHIATATENLEIVRTLIEHGASVDISARSGQTSLHMAVDRRSIHIIKLLLDNGASIDARDASQRTPLHIATCNASVRIVRLLVDMGASLESLDESQINTVRQYGTFS